MDFNDAAAAVTIRDNGLRAVERSGSEPQAYSQIHESRILGDDIRGGQSRSRDERLSGQWSAQERDLYN